MNLKSSSSETTDVGSLESERNNINYTENLSQILLSKNLSVGDKDPTREFNWVENRIWKPSNDFVDPFIDRILQSRIVVVDCFDPFVKVALKKSWFDYFKQDNDLDIRELIFGTDKNHVLHDLLNNKIGRNDRAAVVVDLTSQYSDSFFNSILEVEDSNRRREVIETLEYRGLYIVVFVRDRQRGTIYEKLDDERKFDFWSVPVLDIFVSLYFLDQEDSERRNTLKILNEQRESGIWTKQPGDEENLIKSLKIYLDTDREKSKKRLIDVLNRYSEEEEIRKRRNFFDAHQPEKLLNSREHLLNRYILFVATFFRELSPSEFRVVIEHLLFALDRHRRKKDEDPTLLEIWNENQDEHLQHAGLNLIFSLERNIRVWDFIEGYSRIEFETYFELNRPNDMISFFEKLVFDQKLLYNTQGYILLNILNLYERLAGQDPESFIFRFFSRLLIQSAGREVQIEELDIRSVFDALVSLERQKEEEYFVLAIFLDRISYVENKLVRQRVEDFLLALIKYRDSNGFDQVAMKLIIYLRQNPQFDALFWFKQLLLAGKTAVYDLLLDYMIEEENPVRLRKNFETIFSWTEDTSLSGPTLNKISSSLFLDYAIRRAHMLPYDKYGEEKTEYPLFAAIIETEQSTEVEKIINWILKAYASELNKTRLEWAAIRIGNIVEEWHALLLGIDNMNGDHHPNVDLMEIILGCLVRLAPKQMIISFSSYLDTQKKEYYQLRTNPAYNEHRNIINKRLSALNRLHTNFRKMR